MNRSHPPRLALALLRRFVGDDALIGDLVEQFGRGRSALWFWRQALLATLIGSIRPRDPEFPLGLVEPSRRAPAPRQWAPERRRVNLTASPVAGAGGVSLLIFGFLVALVRPEAVWLLLPAMAAGAVFGIALARVRRHRMLSVPGRAHRILL